MIIGFAHICLNTASVTEAVTPLIEQGYKISGKFIAVPSASEKWSLLSRPATRHDLILLEGPLPIEVVKHDTSTYGKDSNLNITEDYSSLVLSARDEVSEQAFMTLLGFQPLADGSLKLKSQFSQWSVQLKFSAKARAAADPMLDVDGFSCLAFYSTDPIEDGERLKAAGARDITNAFSIVLGKRSMSIIMLRSPEGIIIELIKVLR